MRGCTLRWGRPDNSWAPTVREATRDWRGVRRTSDEGQAMRDERRGARGEGRGTGDEGRGTRDGGRGARDEGRGRRGEGGGRRVGGCLAAVLAPRVAPGVSNVEWRVSRDEGLLSGGACSARSARPVQCRVWGLGYPGPRCFAAEEGSVSLRRGGQDKDTGARDRGQSGRCYTLELQRRDRRAKAGSRWMYLSRCVDGSMCGASGRCV